MWLFIAAVSASRFTEIVETENGPVRGTVESVSESFLGIPFADPPVGPLRFLRSQRLSRNWTDTLNATTAAAMCMQPSGDGVSGSEDCLYLNIFRPTRRSRETLLPVMVFIYGGAFVTGDGIWGQANLKEWNVQGYHGGNVASENNVIFVSLNYRLNIFGFLATEALTDANGGVAGNLGVLDQREGLRWVKRNIERFGGDPSRVMLYGESAGAFSTIFHAVSPVSREENLFSSVGVLSGTSEVNWFFQPKKNRLQCTRATLRMLVAQA